MAEPVRADFAIDVTGPKPVISGAAYRASKSRLEIGVGSLDATELEIRVNGVTVAPRAGIKRKPIGTGGTQLRVKGSASDLHVSATAGANWSWWYDRRLRPSVSRLDNGGPVPDDLDAKAELIASDRAGLHGTRRCRFLDP